MSKQVDQCGCLAVRPSIHPSANRIYVTVSVYKRIDTRVWATLYEKCQSRVGQGVARERQNDTFERGPFQRDLSPFFDLFS